MSFLRKQESRGLWMITSIFSRTKDFMGRLEQVLQATPYPLGPVQWLVQSLSSHAVYLEMSGKILPKNH
jgi:hypothetical protein